MCWWSSQILLRTSSALRILPSPTSISTSSLAKSNIAFSLSSGIVSQFRLFSSSHKQIVKMSTSTESPLLKEWNHTPHGLPPFTEIEPSQFEAALQFAMQEHIREVQVIAANTEEATFDNTIATFDRSGTLFSKVCETFENLCSSNGVPELQAVELKMAGPLAAHYNQLATIPGLFAKIDAVYNQRHALNLNSEQIRLVERFHLDFVRAGAKFSTEMQTAYGKIVEELAELSTKFTQVSHFYFDINPFLDLYK